LKTHIPGFDLLRLAALLAVVGIHCSFTNATAGGLAAYLSFAVPSLVMLSVYLSGERLPSGKPPFPYVWLRAKRLLPAFAAWTMVYVAMRMGGGRLTAPTAQEALAYLLLGSAALHLYFVPMIFYFAVIQSLLNWTGPLNGPLAAVGFAISLWLQQHPPAVPGLGSPEANAFPLYCIRNLPFLFAGILFSRLLGLKRIAGWGNITKACLSTLFMALFCYLWLRPGIFPWHNVWRDMALFLGALFFPLSVSEGLKRLSAVGFGIYLCHHLLVEGLLRAEDLLRLDSGWLWVTASRFVLTAVFSAALSLALAKKRWTEWLVR
jgi:surface polysaccharide O-acyltransferase-like enzyme